MRPLQERDLSQKFGTKYGVQKNRMNGQIILYTRVVYHPKYCSVVLGLNIVARAEVLGNTWPDDPLCVYRDEDGIPVSHWDWCH